MPDLTTSSLNMIPDVVRSRKKPKLVFQPKPLSKRFSHKNVTLSSEENYQSGHTEIGNPSRRYKSTMLLGGVQLTDVDSHLDQTSMEFKIKAP